MDSKRGDGRRRNAAVLAPASVMNNQATGDQPPPASESANDGEVTVMVAVMVMAMTMMLVY